MKQNDNVINIHQKKANHHNNYNEAGLAQKSEAAKVEIKQKIASEIDLTEFKFMGLSLLQLMLLLSVIGIVLAIVLS